METVYSGATQLFEKAQRLSDKNLAAYIFNHYWQFEFLRPTIDEIVTKYLEMHGSAAPEEEQKKATSLTQTRRRRRRR